MLQKEGARSERMPSPHLINANHDRVVRIIATGRHILCVGN